MDFENDHWQGWLIAGKYLVTPTREKITAGELAQLVTMHKIRLHFETVGLQAQANTAKERKKKRVRQVVKVVLVDLADWKAGHVQSAG